jgi:ABC-2 type transport system permease protein
MVKYRENVMLLVVFASVPLLFLTGASWPQSNIPSYWQGVSWLFPSTFGARAYIRLNSMGADLSDVMPELRILWIQAVCYFVLAVIVYRFQIYRARVHALERLRFLKHNREARHAEKIAQEK